MKLYNYLFGWFFWLILSSSCIATEFKTVVLTINNQLVATELAISTSERQQGLQGRKSLCQNCAMLFVFEKKRHVNFWMKNTFIPLDIAYLDNNGQVLEIHQLQPLNEQGVASKTEVKFALEMNQGWFALNNISVGSKISISSSIPKQLEDACFRAITENSLQGMLMKECRHLSN